MFGLFTVVHILCVVVISEEKKTKEGGEEKIKGSSYQEILMICEI